MITSDIIDRFHLQVDDSSELSTEEELALANEVYNEICSERSWAWLQTSYTTTASTTVPYVALPADFRELLPNYDLETQILVGTDYTPYKVVNWSERRNYRDMVGLCYLDYPNLRIYFTKQPIDTHAIEFDYVKIQPALTLSTSPLFRADYHDIIAYGMASKFDPIQLTPQGESYQKVNGGLYEQKLEALRMEDARVKLAVA